MQEEGRGRRKEGRKGGILLLKILPLKIHSMNDVGSIKKEAPLFIQSSRKLLNVSQGLSTKGESSLILSNL